MFNIKQLTKGNNMDNLKNKLTALGTVLTAGSAQAYQCLYQALLNLSTVKIIRPKRLVDDLLYI